MLNLSNNELTEIPKELGNLANLQALNLEGNRLTTVPKELGYLSNLKKLSLYDNVDLREIPRELTENETLEIITRIEHI